MTTIEKHNPDQHLSNNMKLPHYQHQNNNKSYTPTLPFLITTTLLITAIITTSIFIIGIDPETILCYLFAIISGTLFRDPEFHRWTKIRFVGLFTVLSLICFWLSLHNELTGAWYGLLDKDSDGEDTGFGFDFDFGLWICVILNVLALTIGFVQGWLLKSYLVAKSLSLQNVFAQLDSQFYGLLTRKSIVTDLQMMPDLEANINGNLGSDIVFPYHDANRVIDDFDEKMSYRDTYSRDVGLTLTDLLEKYQDDPRYVVVWEEKHENDFGYGGASYSYGNWP
ncbi:unnamed protein product [Ambrosiozyma monospora]|uniref:Unnamed protein product n=1 Tax=Ambrosiozyma monospora TaxID=43982 RepID=A0ACB5T296_AMBMO|nr:unnamed protein product [Ambrosiozyma monospora]